MNLKINAPAKAEAQTARITLNITPSLKARVTAAAKRYDTSNNSLINQLVEAGLNELAEQSGEGE